MDKHVRLKNTFYERKKEIKVEKESLKRINEVLEKSNGAIIGATYGVAIVGSKDETVLNFMKIVNNLKTAGFTEEQLKKLIDNSSIIEFLTMKEDGQA